MKNEIYGIIFEHGANDYSLWEDFSLAVEEENTISEILYRHDTEGCSIRGTLEECFGDLLGREVPKFRTIKLYGGMTGEYEIIRTDAPDSAIKAEIVYCNSVSEEHSYRGKSAYPIMEALGYNVRCIGCQDDFDEREKEVDAEFDYYGKY